MNRINQAMGHGQEARGEYPCEAYLRRRAHRRHMIKEASIIAVKSLLIIGALWVCIIALYGLQVIYGGQP